MKSEKYLTIYLVSKLFRVSSIFGNYEVLHLHQFCIKQTMASGFQVKPKKIRWKFSGMAPFVQKFRFSWISVLLWWNNPSACCGGNFDASDFYFNSSFEPVYPNRCPCVNRLASSSSQSEERQICFAPRRPSLKQSTPGSILHLAMFFFSQPFFLSTWFDHS